MDRPLPAYEGGGSYVFVCYAHEDRGEVYPELTRLSGGGFNVWYDDREPGSAWSDDTASHIERSAVFLYFVTPRSVVSEHCRREVSFALEEECVILAVHLEPTVLPGDLALSLSGRQAILKHVEPREVYEAKLDEALRRSTAGQGFAPAVVARQRRSRWTAVVLTVVAAAVIAAGYLMLHSA